MLTHLWQLKAMLQLLKLPWPVNILLNPVPRPWCLLLRPCQLHPHKPYHTIAHHVGSHYKHQREAHVSAGPASSWSASESSSTTSCNHTPSENSQRRPADLGTYHTINRRIQKTTVSQILHFQEVDTLQDQASPGQRAQRLFRYSCSTLSPAVSSP